MDQFPVEGQRKDERRVSREDAKNAEERNGIFLE